MSAATTGEPEPVSRTVGDTAKAVAADVGDLVRAELELAKAELAEGARSKATGLGLLVGTAVFAWLAAQGLLITAGIALAIVLPAWAAALIVSGVLLLLALVLALIARRKLSAPLGIDTAKAQAQEDLAWAKGRLRATDTPEQVREDIAWTREQVTRR